MLFIKALIVQYSLNSTLKLESIYRIHMNKLSFLIISATFVGGFTSCMQRYDAPAVNDYEVQEWQTKEVATHQVAICPDPERVLKEALFVPYWQIFQDPILDDLEYQAIKDSPKVQAAVARLEEAMASYGISYAEVFPEVTLDVQASRQRISQTSDLAGVSSHVSSLSVMPKLSYDLDFWGKNWQAAKAAMYQVNAEQEDVQNTLLELTSAVADSYLQVRTYDTELRTLYQALASRHNNYDVNIDQYNAGLINELAVYQAKSVYESVAADIENTQRLRALEEHRLAELLGQPASIFRLEKQDALPFLPTIASGVPSTVLQRRPDIRQAKALIKASEYAVGVAKTLYFPDFTLSLNYGFMSKNADKLFDWKSHAWKSALDAITPIFTANRISSTIDQAVAQYKQSVAAYLDTVLLAFKQVEDSLYSIEATKRRLMHLELEVKASQEAYDLAEERYRLGLENYILVVDTERTLLEAQRMAIQATRALYTNTISLISSLGGYWD